MSHFLRRGYRADSAAVPIAAPRTPAPFLLFARQVFQLDGFVSTTYELVPAARQQLGGARPGVVGRWVGSVRKERG